MISSRKRAGLASCCVEKINNYKSLTWHRCRELNVNIPNFYSAQRRKQVAWFRARFDSRCRRLNISRHLITLDLWCSIGLLQFVFLLLHTNDSKLLINKNNYLMPVIDLLRHSSLLYSRDQKQAIINDLTILVHSLQLLNCIARVAFKSVATN